MLYNPAMPPTNGVLNNLSTRVEKRAIGRTSPEADRRSGNKSSKSIEEDPRDTYLRRDPVRRGNFGNCHD